MAAENAVVHPLLHDGNHATAREKKPLPGAAAVATRFRHCRSAFSSLVAREAHPPRSKNVGQKGGSPSVPPKELLITGERPSFRLVGILLLAYLLAGTTAFYLAMDDTYGERTVSRVLDALYFSVVTMTTVGYGDIVPASDAAKLLACIFAFAGIGLVGAFLSKAADYLVEKQEALLFRATNLHLADNDRKVLRHMEVNKTRNKLYTAAVLLAIVLASGVAFLVMEEAMRLVDAVYCVCATVTTLGYGDRSFSSMAGRAFASVWITVSTLVVTLFFLYTAELGAERRQRVLAHWVLTRQTTTNDLEAADIDGDHSVSAAEFALYKLKELGKISQQDISEFLEQFEELDVDHSGTLTRSDLVVVHPAS
jgi:potassium channel subfamily K, other eukaryote